MYSYSMECAMGKACRAIVLAEFYLLGQTIHYARPDFWTKRFIKLDRKYTLS